MKKDTSKEGKPSAAHVAEAAAWVAHLHNGGRTPGSDCGHKLWLKDAPDRQRAWELATDVWEDLRRVPTAAVVKELEVTQQSLRARRRHVWSVTGLAAGVLVALIAAWMWRDPGVTTNIGEQRTVSLKDGTQVTLNTATRIAVRFSKQARRVELKSGEALFDVAQHADWPFVVVADDREIKALGTSFVVRRDRGQVSVTLMDGKVAVSNTSATSSREVKREAYRAVILTPGQRLTFANTDAPPKLDRPSIEKVTAWRRGRVVFEGTRLAEAIAEMNRYNEQRLSVEDAAAADVQISGVFKYGDSLKFAQAVAATYHLRIAEEGERITLVGVPERAYQ